MSTQKVIIPISNSLKKEEVIEMIKKELFKEKDPKISKMREVWKENILDLKLIVEGVLYRSEITVNDSDVSIEWLSCGVNSLAGAIETMLWDK